MDESFINQVEDEDVGKPMKDPFDPSKIKVRTQTITIEGIVERIRHNEIDLSTQFQRKEGLWSDEQQSRLIESVLIRFPLPVFYFDGSDPNKWQVIDGLQRLTSLKRFMVTKELKLTGLEFLKLEGTWDELDRPSQRQIKETQLQCYVLEEGTESEVKFNMFKRINTGGLVLSSQEIRHAMHQDGAAQFVKKLADTKEFKKATQHKINRDRMLDRDFVNRFLAFYLFDHEKSYNYNDDLDSFMNKSLTEISLMSTIKKNEIENNFIQAMLLSVKVFEDFAFCKKKDYKRINKALFEVVSVSFAKLNDEQRTKLSDKKNKFKSLLYKSIDSNFRDSLSSNTGGKSNIALRHSEFDKVVKQILNE